MREVKPVAEIAESLALTLATLDENEATVINNAELVMLCGRTPELSEDFDREALRTSLRNQRLISYAESYLAELMSNAIIHRP